MEKWTEPRSKLPSFLDGVCEVTHENTRRYSIDYFSVECMECCLRLGCAPMQASEVTANTRNESANGQSYRCNNLYGWKLTEGYAREYRQTHDGNGPPFWRAPGNKAPGATLTDPKGGDPPWCYYRVFETFEGSLAEWLKHFVPQPTEHAPYGSYRKCGELFWSGGDWFPELIRCGYKGENTRKHPDLSIAEHRDTARTSAIRWAQSRMKIGIDGKWGALSRTACLLLQSRYGKPATGELDADTLVLIAKETPLPGR